VAAPRKHSDEQIAEALAIYQRDGLAAAARKTGMPKGTIASLAHRNGMQTYASPNMQEAVAHRQAERVLKLEQIKDGFADLTIHMQERAMEEEKGTQAQAWTTASAISADKLLLMSGEATSRHETRSDLDGIIVRRLKEIERGARDGSSDDGVIIDPDAIEAESQAG
jgi:hypothetical protein